MTKVLVVDDEAPIVDAISYNLKKEGFAVDTAADADECLMRIQTGAPDLVVLDVMLPSGSGLDICRRLHQERADLPVLLLTARAAEDDRLRGFGAGADDYVVKPFSMRELMARVHALLRRSGARVIAGHRNRRSRNAFCFRQACRSMPSAARCVKTGGPSPFPARNSICCPCWPPTGPRL